jgi:hypothetical protein
MCFVLRECGVSSAAVVTLSSSSALISEFKTCVEQWLS